MQVFAKKNDLANYYFDQICMKNYLPTRQQYTHMIENIKCFETGSREGPHIMLILGL
jgi:hypothetical protein